MTLFRLIFGGVVMTLSMSVVTVGRTAETPGEVLYAEHCGQCHGSDARGGKGPKLVPFRRSAAETLQLVRYPECEMPPISDSEVSDDEVVEIVGYLKSLK
jgi:mono/diheme cytochrome c family protein